MINDSTKPILDGVSITVVVAALASWLPAVAAFFTIVWTMIRIYETETVKKLIDKLRKKK